MKNGNEKNNFVEGSQQNIREGEVKKGYNGKIYKEKNVNDNDKIDKIEDKPEKGSEGL